MLDKFGRLGVDAFADHELLEVLLYYTIRQGDTNLVAHALMQHFGSLHAVLEATADQLCEVEGVGPYLASRQVVAVDAQSGIQTMSELAGKTIAVQATGKPEAIFLRGGANVPAFRDIISLADRGVQYAMLDCGYVDAVAAHEEAIRQYMKDYGANFRILDEPLLVTGIGVAFSRHDTRGLAAQLDEVFEQMREDGSMEKLAGKYLDDPTHSLEVDALEQ